MKNIFVGIAASLFCISSAFAVANATSTTINIKFDKSGSAIFDTDSAVSLTLINQFKVVEQSPKSYTAFIDGIHYKTDSKFDLIAINAENSQGYNIQFYCPMVVHNNIINDVVSGSVVGSIYCEPAN